MSSRNVLSALLLAALVGACASHSRAAREQPEGPPPKALFQSPIALLLDHHDELMLTTDQMIALGQREEALREKNRPLREKVRDARPAPPPAPPVSELPTPTGSSGGWGGPLSGWGGGMSSAPLPVSQPRPPPESDEELARRKREADAALHEIEANEAAAYEDAEKLLDEKQKPRARELFTQQREERQRLREARRAPQPPPKS